MRIARMVFLLVATVGPGRSAGAQPSAPMPELDQVRTWLQSAVPQFVRGDSGLNGAVLVVDTAGTYVKSIAFRLTPGEFAAWGRVTAKAAGLQDDTASSRLLWGCVESSDRPPAARQPLCLLDGARVRAVENLRLLAGRDVEVLKGDSASKRFGPDGANGAVLVTTDTVALEKYRSVGATPATFVEFSGYNIRRRADGQNVVITVLKLRKL